MKPILSNASSVLFVNDDFTPDKVTFFTQTIMIRRNVDGTYKVFPPWPLLRITTRGAYLPIEDGSNTLLADPQIQKLAKTLPETVPDARDPRTLTDEEILSDTRRSSNKRVAGQTSA